MKVYIKCTTGTIYNYHVVGFFEVLKFYEWLIYFQFFHDFIFMNESAKNSGTTMGQPYSWFFERSNFEVKFHIIIMINIHEIHGIYIPQKDQLYGTRFLRLASSAICDIWVLAFLWSKVSKCYSVRDIWVLVFLWSKVSKCCSVVQSVIYTALQHLYTTLTPTLQHFDTLDQRNARTHAYITNTVKMI